MMAAGLLATGLLRWMIVVCSALFCYRMLRRCSDLPLGRLLVFSLIAGLTLAAAELAHGYFASQRSLLGPGESNRAELVASVVARQLEVSIQRLPLLILVNTGGFFAVGICIGVFVSVRQRCDGARSTHPPE